MLPRKISSFSPCGEIFVCENDDGNLTFWETSSNNIKQEFNIKSHLNTASSSITWASFRNTSINDDKEIQLLVFGTEIGNIFMYDYCAAKLYNHFTPGHTDEVTGLCFDSDSKSLFSCSSDKSVIVWDTNSGKITEKWTADDEKIYSICLIDSNNLLTASKSILWWNVEEKTIVKKFSCIEAPVTILSVVKSIESSACSYFIAVASGETKISAWSLNEKSSKNAVASFVLNSEPLNIDVSESFSKENPLHLTTVTKNGVLVLFEHVLNGKTKNLMPQMTLQIMSKPVSRDCEPSSIPIIASKVLDAAESCIIAYGYTDNPVFESVNIFDCPKTLTLARDEPTQQKVTSGSVPKIKFCNTFCENIIANGQTSPALSPFKSSKKKKNRETEEDIYISQTEAIEISKEKYASNRISPTSSPNVKKKKLSKKQVKKSSSEEKLEKTEFTDPSEMLDFLLKGLEEEKNNSLNLVLRCDNSELIKSTVKNVPLQSLNSILIELHRRLILQEERYNSSLIKWLKEILTIHLPYLITCKDLKDILYKLKELVDSRNVSQTLVKMNMLKGLLRMQLQNLSKENESCSSESDSEESMIS